MIRWHLRPSTPIVQCKKKVKKAAVIEKKAKKSKWDVTLGTTSAPPKLGGKKGGKGNVDDGKIPKVRKTLFCRPEDPIDNDFYLNYHASNSVGYEGEHNAVEIPEVSIHYIFLNKT
ncbi:hypothetical protein RYX36_013678 [Vicia faba]